MPTVVTSNRAPKDIDPRIFSRLSDRALSQDLILLEADDFRQLKVEQRYPVQRARRPGQPPRRLSRISDTSTANRLPP